MITTDPIQQVTEAILFLAARCDGSQAEDFNGFNKNDSRFGKSLAQWVKEGRTLTEKQLLGFYSKLVKYQKNQLKPNGLYLPSKEALIKAINNTPEMVAKRAARKIDIKDDLVCVYFPYDTTIKAAVDSMPTARWVDRGENNKYWTIEVQHFIKLMNRLKVHSFTLSEMAKAYLEEQINISNQKDEETRTIELWIDQYIAKYSKDWKLANGSNLDLYQHQIEAIKYLSTRNHLNGAILADGMGLGKTFSSLVTAKFLQGFYKYKDKVDVSIIIVCPKSVKDDWIKTAKVLNVAVEVYTWQKIPVAPKRAKYILLGDEAHFIQNISSQRTKKFLELSHDENCLRVFPITGTPMKNGRPSNLYPLLAAVNHPIARNRTEYEKRYCAAKATQFTKWDITGAINLDELREETLDAIIHRKQEDCINLPEKIEMVINCDENDKAEKEYQEAYDELKREYQRRVKEGEISNKAQAVVFLGYLRRLASNYKTYQVIETAEEILESGSNVTIFTTFKESALKIAEHFKVTALTGELNDEDRTKLKEDFQAGITRVFVGTIQSGGAGITLTNGNYNLIVDYPWTTGDLEQCKARIYRIGQTKTSFIYNFHAKEIDLIIAAILQQKGENIDRVIQKYDLDVTKNLEELKFELVEKLLGA